MWIFRKIFRFVMEAIEVFVISMSVFIVVYLFLVQPHQVRGNSMHPTFKNKEYLLTDKVTYRTRRPEVGDVVVFKSPENEAFDFIKRVIGEPGDRVMVKSGEVYLNGQLLNEYYLPPEYTTQAGRYMRDGVEIVVPEGHYIVMGDNRGHSSDSREWGPVPLQNFVGKGFFRYWPPGVAGYIPNAFKGTDQEMF